MSLVAAGVSTKPSAAFRDPGLTEPTSTTIEEIDGGLLRIFGHLAAWGVCHIGIQDTCTTAPHSAIDYAMFRTGTVNTEEGRIAVGQITMGTGHAGLKVNARTAVSHYDNTGTAVADVVVGEDNHGIWFSGWVRPGTPDEMLHAARASKLSGDWRRVGTSMEMVAALAVNVPGFRIPRLAAGMLGERQVSLVAAGVVAPEQTEPQQAVLDGVQAREMARLVAEEMVALQSRRDAMMALSQRVKAKN